MFKQKNNRMKNDWFNHGCHNHGGYLLTEGELIDYIENYDVNYVIDEFKGNPKGKINWWPLIDPVQYKTALSEFMRYGRLMRFPGGRVYQWMGIVMRNVTILDSCTYLLGHKEDYPYHEIQEELLEPNGAELKEWDSMHYVSIPIGEEDAMKLMSSNEFQPDKGKTNEENCEAFNNSRNSKGGFCPTKLMFYDGTFHRLTSLDTYLDNVGLFDFCSAPDGGWAVSDYGLGPLYDIVSKYDDGMSPEEVLVLVNRALDVTHMRNDLSSYFIEGGKNSLGKISNGGVLDEGKKRKVIIITEAQKRTLIMG